MTRAGKKDLEQGLRDYYENRALGQEQVDRLLAQARSSTTHESQHRELKGARSPHEKAGGGPARAGHSRSSRALPMVAALLAAIVALVLIVAKIHDSSESVPLSRRVAIEIARNHLKDLDPEFRTGDLRELQREMTKLDFSLVPPDQRYLSSGPLVGELESAADGARLGLRGARYCSLQGQLAAQLEYEDAGGRTHTLYQTRDSDLLADIGAEQLNVHGLRLRLWAQSGVFFGLASPKNGE